MEDKKSKNIEMPTTQGMTMEQQLSVMKEMLMAVLQAAKEPSAVEKLQLEKIAAEEAKKEKKRLDTRAELNRDIAAKAQKAANCPHLRGDNTSSIAWYTFTNGGVPVRTIGVCQRCPRIVETSDSDYQMLRRIPTSQVRLA